MPGSADSQLKKVGVVPDLAVHQLFSDVLERRNTDDFFFEAIQMYTPRAKLPVPMRAVTEKAKKKKLAEQLDELETAVSTAKQAGEDREVERLQERIQRLPGPKLSFNIPRTVHYDLLPGMMSVKKKLRDEEELDTGLGSTHRQDYYIHVGLVRLSVDPDGFGLSKEQQKLLSTTLRESELAGVLDGLPDIQTSYALLKLLRTAKDKDVAPNDLIGAEIANDILRCNVITPGQLYVHATRYANKNSNGSSEDSGSDDLEAIYSKWLNDRFDEYIANLIEAKKKYPSSHPKKSKKSTEE